MYSIKNAILNGNLNEKVFIYASHGLDVSKGLHFKNVFYGLKQTLKTWFDKFNSVIF